MAGVPVRATRTPSRGRARVGDRSRAAVSPTTMTAGGRTPASSAASGSCSSGARTAAGWGAQPPETTAAGVSGARPAAISRWTMAGSWDRPMRMTRVPSAPASRSSWSEAPSFVWAVITWKLRLSPRWVTGMPAWPGMAMAEEMPGTTSKGMPTRWRAWISSPPRPKTKGSPPLRRTTACPAWAREMSVWEMSSWGAEWRPSRLPI